VYCVTEATKYKKKNAFRKITFSKKKRKVYKFNFAFSVSYRMAHVSTSEGK